MTLAFTLTKGRVFYDVRTSKFEDVKKKNMYIFQRLLQKKELKALRGSRKRCSHFSSADHVGSGTNCLEIYARDLERMSCKEQGQRSFPSKNIT